MNVPQLIVLTDRAQLPPGRDLVETMRACADAGLTQVIVREHDLDDETRHVLVTDLAAIDGLVVVSSRVPDPAAAGLHLSADQEPPVQAGPDRAWFGRSCHTSEEVDRAVAEGAAYVTLSPFAVSRSKPGYGPPVDRAAYADHDVPVLALGGIDPGNAGRARAAGAHGVAVMGCVMRAASPAATVRLLLAEVEA